MSNRAACRLDDVISKLPPVPHVYFMRTQKDNDWYIRVGFSSRGYGQRVSDHEGSGHDFIAAIPGTMDDESRIHAHFNPWLSPKFKKSHYPEAEIKWYVEALIQRRMATTDRTLLPLLARVKFPLWSPAHLAKPLRGSFWPHIAARVDERDTWQTPAPIFEAATQVFGDRPDLDPASDLEAYYRPAPEHRPKYFYTKEIDGLKLDWHGTVFLNPPYGGEKEPGADRFTKKLIKEIQAGRVTEAIVLLNLQSVPTIWFRYLSEELDLAWAIPKRRLHFFGPPAEKTPSSTRYGASKNGTIFVYYGPHKARFWRVFGDFCYPMALVNPHKEPER